MPPIFFARLPRSLLTSVPHRPSVPHPFRAFAKRVGYLDEPKSIRPVPQRPSVPHPIRLPKADELGGIPRRTQAKSPRAPSFSTAPSAGKECESVMTAHECYLPRPGLVTSSSRLLCLQEAAIGASTWTIPASPVAQARKLDQGHSSGFAHKPRLTGLR